FVPHWSYLPLIDYCLPLIAIAILHSHTPSARGRELPRECAGRNRSPHSRLLHLRWRSRTSARGPLLHHSSRDLGQMGATSQRSSRATCAYVARRVSTFARGDPRPSAWAIGRSAADHIGVGRSATDLASTSAPHPT